MALMMPLNFVDYLKLSLEWLFSSMEYVVTGRRSNNIFIFLSHARHREKYVLFVTPVGKVIFTSANERALAKQCNLTNRVDGTYNS